VVTVVPNVLLLAYVGFLLAAGAPAHSLSIARAIKVADGLTLGKIVAILLGILIISVATHPLQIPLIQLVEGYWRALPFGLVAADRFTDRFRNELLWVRNELQRVQGIQHQDWAARQAADEAEDRQFWLPEREQDLLPTVLGNTLKTGEIRAGSRYGLELDLALPRLTPLMSPSNLAELSDRRNQLDAAVRLCLVAGLATVVSVGLLLRQGAWLFLALVTYLLCWACYRAAVAAARGFSISLAAAIDLHHLQLFDALQLERPANLAQELERNKTLTMLFRDEPLSKKAQNDLRYIASKSDQQPAESATGAPLGS
jgi:hypothetical protein